MNLPDAERLAVSLMRHHGLYKYKFVWLQRRKKFWLAGQCNWRKKTIALSPTFAEYNHPVVVKWTMLHEIAHAMCNPRAGHNKFWRAKAQALGHRGNRTYGKYVKRPT